MNNDLLARLVERVEGRFYGKYRAIVADAADPERRGRLRLRIPAVLGGEVISGWALPCAPYGGSADRGFFFIPEKDSTVWVEFESGDPDYPVWVGTFWGKPGASSEAPKPGDEQVPPTRKVLRTGKGSCIEIEDKEGEEVFIIQYNDSSKKNTVTMNKDGILIEDANDNKITLDENRVRIQTAKDIELKADGDIRMDAANVRVKVSGVVRIQTAKDIELKAGGDIKMDAANVKVKVSGVMDVE